MKTLRALLVELGACPEARKWVGGRSFGECWPKASNVWREWFAQRAYDAAVEPAERAYSAAVDLARRAYHAAVAEAWSARQAYGVALEPAEPARRTYDVAVESAWRAFHAEIEPAQRAVILSVWPWLLDGPSRSPGR